MNAKHPVGIATALLLGMLVAAFVLRAQGLRINTSASEPVGIYWMQPYRGETLVRGQLIAFCPPINQRDYPFVLKGSCAGGTEPFLKQVLAVPGDRVRAGAQGVCINGQPLADSKPKERSEAAQQPLPHWRGERRLGAGEFWVYGSGDPKNSFDSRYYGPIQAGQIISVEKPSGLKGRHHAG